MLRMIPVVEGLPPVEMKPVVELVTKIVHEDRRLTVRLISDELGLN